MRSLKWLAVLTVFSGTGQFSQARSQPPSPTEAQGPTETSNSSGQPRVSPETPSQPSSTNSAAKDTPTTTPAQANPPATARQYLEAAAKLHNKGRYELADRYLKAAARYKDRLTLNEQIVLGVYREKVDKELKRLSTPLSVAEPPRPARFSSDKIDPGVKAAGAEASSHSPESVVEKIDSGLTALDQTKDPFEVSSKPEILRMDQTDEDPLKKLYGSQTARNGDDTKQRGRWLLQLAREQIYRGNYEKAKEIVGKVKQMNISWGYFDDSPEKVTEALAKVEENKRNGSSDPTSKGAFDRQTAKARLREARAALMLGDFEQAEAIADEVRSWRIGFYFFDDTPEKVYSAIDSARRKSGSPSGRPNSEQSPSDPLPSFSPRSSDLSPEVPLNNQGADAVDLGRKSVEPGDPPR